MGATQSTNKVEEKPNPSPPTADKCPVDHNSRQAWANLGSGPLQSPHKFHAQPSAPLSTERETSSIPRGAAGDTDASQKWEYPSEAQFYAALMRKHQATSAQDSASHGEGAQDANLGKGLGDVELDSAGRAVTNRHDVKLPQARDMRVVVPIHNAVNEQTWAKILEWEASQGGESCGGVRLVSFKGDSRKISPKARWNILLGYQRPFDRHDWVVDRCGTKVRYVIDYYTGRTAPTSPRGQANPVSFYIDARPALDNWEGVRMRASKFWTTLFDNGSW